MITRERVAHNLRDYLHHRLSLPELVDWAEEAMREEEFGPEHFEDIRFVIARLGVADVRAFGLTWEDCEQLLERLGYQARIEVQESKGAKSFKG